MSDDEVLGGIERTPMKPLRAMDGGSCLVCFSRLSFSERTQAVQCVNCPFRLTAEEFYFGVENTKRLHMGRYVHTDTDRGDDR